jgi:hypothetical protein
MVNHSKRVAARLLTAFLVVFAASTLSATTFVMPTDDEMIARAKTIIVGTVEGSYVREANKSLETVYEVRVERRLKGAGKVNELVKVVSPGGILGERGVLVHSAAHFANGDRVLLFLNPSGDAMTPVDLTLGKFRFVTSSKGERLLARDIEDFVAFDRTGAPHTEQVRREDAFLRYIGDRVGGRRNQTDDADYFVDASSVVLPPVEPAGRRITTDVAPYTAGSYTSNFNADGFGCGTCPVGFAPMRWVNADAGITFVKNTANMIDTVDGGVGVIQNGLAAWTNDCESNVTLNYGASTTALPNTDDNINVIVFNDAGNVINGSFNGSGIVAVTTSSFWTFEDMFDGQEWWRILDSDISFQDGYTGAQASFQVAMTHELGHAIGFRHSNADPTNGNGSTVGCSSAEEDCTTTATAIMWFQTVSAFGATLQPWDQNAVRAVYPGGSCVTVLPPTNVVATATTSTNVNITWTAATGASTYNVYRKAAGGTFSVVGSSGTTAYNDTVTAGQAYLYTVRSMNGTESSDSNVDLATAIIFTDSTLTLGASTAKAVHFTELRSAVNAVRALTVGLGPASFTDSTLSAGTTGIRLVHLSELRSALDAARASLSLSAVGYTDTTLTASTAIKAAHVTDLRNGVQ